MWFFHMLPGEAQGWANGRGWACQAQRTVTHRQLRNLSVRFSDIVQRVFKPIDCMAQMGGCHSAALQAQSIERC